MRLHSNDDPKSNIKIFSGLVLLIVLAHIAFVLKPAFTQLKTQKAGYSQLVQQVGVGRAKANELANFARQVASLRREVTRIESRLSAERAMPLLLRDAEQLAKSAKVKLGAIEPGGLTTHSGYSERSVRLNLEAGPGGLSAFIRGLESLPYVVRVDSAEVQTGSLTAGAKLQVNLGATMYTLEKGGEQSNEPVKPADAMADTSANG